MTATVDTWVEERTQYNFSNPGFTEQTQNFTQIVWKSTTNIGCGTHFCNGNNGVAGWMVVCEYSPAGNVQGAFGANVQDAIQGWRSCARGGDCPSTKNSTRSNSGDPSGGATSSATRGVARLGVFWKSLVASTLFLFLW